MSQMNNEFKNNIENLESAETIFNAMHNMV